MRGRRPSQRHDHRTPLSIQAVTVEGRQLIFPIEVREARSWAATFAVPADPAQHLIADTGLRVARVLPGRALLSLVFVDYVDTDLDAYHEFGVAFLVKGPRGRGVYIHQLPVDQDFTLAAGREIWGYPKFRAEIRIDERGREATCSLRHDGADVLRLTVRSGVLPLPQPTVPTYTWCDGVLRLTKWTMEGSSRQRIGGATVHLGSHPIAGELLSLGLPRRALAVSVTPRYSARFGPPEVVDL